MTVKPRFTLFAAALLLAACGEPAAQNAASAAPSASSAASAPAVDTAASSAASASAPFSLAMKTDLEQIWSVLQPGFSEQAAKEVEWSRRIDAAKTTAQVQAVAEERLALNDKQWRALQDLKLVDSTAQSLRDRLVLEGRKSSEAYQAELAVAREKSGGVLSEEQFAKLTAGERERQVEISQVLTELLKLSKQAGIKNELVQ